MPTVAELYPEILKPDEKDDDLPSCSAAVALTRQETFINQDLAYQPLGVPTQLCAMAPCRIRAAFAFYRWYNTCRCRFASAHIVPNSGDSAETRSRLLCANVVRDFRPGTRR